jgi:hypothetical protein
MIKVIFSYLNIKNLEGHQFCAFLKPEVIFAIYLRGTTIFLINCSQHSLHTVQNTVRGFDYLEPLR